MLKKFVAFATWGAMSLLLVATGCSPKPGKSCNENDHSVCMDPGTALECKGGTWQAIGCLGAKGCKADESHAVCDVTVAKAGDACREKDEKRYSCSTDKKSQLRCKGGKWVTVAQCTAEPGCNVESFLNSCPGAVSNEGDECEAPTEKDKKRFTCSTDKKSVLVCRDGKWKSVEQCMGAKACNSAMFAVDCDGPTAKANEDCESGEKPDYACAADGKSQLVCAPGATKWAVNSACLGAEGCTSSILGVKCDRTIRNAGDACTKDGDAACSTDGKTVLECKNGKMEKSKECPKKCEVSPLYIQCQD